MADKTFGFKVSDEDYERAKLLIETSGLSSKEWFQNALANYEVKALQTNAPEYTRNLNELELHTTRIYELVVNMVQQSMYFKDQAVREVSEQLEKKEQLLAELQEKLQATKQSVQTLQADKDELTAIQAKQQKQLDEARTAIENSQLLIAEYKDKNDSLTGLVTKYQGYAEENEQLKMAFAEEKEALLTAATNEKQQLEQALTTATNEVKVNEAKATELEKALVEEKAKAEQTTALLQERHELALERAIVKAEREYQEKLQAQLDTYNTRITELHAENDRIRRTYESRLEDVLKNNVNKKN
jgi:chromosome segregation ATPase